MELNLLRLIELDLKLESPSIKYNMEWINDVQVATFFEKQK
jgi:hypothetical protein